MDIYKFQECFQEAKKKESDGTAYRECLKKYKQIGKVIKGPVLKDGKPKHNLYDVSESAQIKIAILLKDQVNQNKEIEC